MIALWNEKTLASHLWQGSASSRLARSILLAVGGSIAIWVSAKIKVDLWPLPVPMTMQTLVILALGMAYGWRLGAATVALYLFEGAMGLPVFAGTPEKGIGLPYMMGPTGGYLMAYVAAAALVGWLAQRGWDRNPITTFAAMLGGNIVIYLGGFLWLSYLFDAEKALQYGVGPFLWGDLVKILLATALMPGLWKLIQRKSAR